MNHAIRIKHWHNPEDKGFSQFPRKWSVRQQSLQNPLKHKTSLRLAGMHSTSNNDCFFVRMISHVASKSISELCKRFVCRQKSLLVLFKEAFNLFFKSGL